MLYRTQLLACSIVLCLLVQPELHRAAQELSSRCNLSDDIQQFICANALHVAQYLQQHSYDVICSWLTILHFSKDERHRFFRSCSQLLQHGGLFYAEDFVELPDQQLTIEEHKILRSEVYCKYVSTIEQYQQDLREAGFTILHVQDLTEEWTTATQQRALDFHAQEARLVHIHGKELFDMLAAFYDQIAKLYKNGHLGGVRIVAQA